MLSPPRVNSWNYSMSINLSLRYVDSTEFSRANLRIARVYELDHGCRYVIKSDELGYLYLFMIKWGCYAI
jgi:hypothetical protein